MSNGLSPSPSPLSASLLVIEVSAYVAPGQLSVTTTLASMLASLWFGGHRLVGVTETEISGGVLSITVTIAWHSSDSPSRSVTVSVTTVSPSWYGPAGV